MIESDVKDTKKAKVKKKGEKTIAVPKIEINEVKEKEDVDSDNDNLVVDENPKLRQSQEKTSSSLKKPGSLKLKLSCKIFLALAVSFFKYFLQLAYHSGIEISLQLEV